MITFFFLYFLFFSCSLIKKRFSFSIYPQPSSVHTFLIHILRFCVNTKLYHSGKNTSTKFQIISFYIDFVLGKIQSQTKENLCKFPLSKSSVMVNQSTSGKFRGTLNGH